MDDELRQYLDKKFAESEERQNRHTEMVETRLLTEFWKWARTADARYRQAHGTVNGLDERVGLVEDRVTAIERGRDKPEVS
jgi:hypothetical protein